MDQAASIMSDPSSALYILFYPLLAASPVPLLQKVVFICTNSLVVSDKATTAKYRYNLRIMETLVGARILAKEIGVTMGNKERITFRQVIGRFLGEEGDLDVVNLTVNFTQDCIFLRNVVHIESIYHQFTHYAEERMDKRES
ncbi:hypothetical protein AX15_002264 [Amanita polypyramis BW_CC]|nr:hypothetical protein AX15_002264 [Amanita polypyramis BW_CC]